jgi:hypothetical protein
VLLYVRQHSRVDCDVTMHCWALRNLLTNEIVYEYCTMGLGGGGGGGRNLIYDGVKLERWGDWIELAINKHTPLPPLNPLFVCLTATLQPKKNYS